MTDNTPEVVPPSPEPDAGVGTGSGQPQSEGAGPAPHPSTAASTSGLGTMDEQQGSGGQSGGAPYSLDGDENPTEPASPSGT